MMAEFQGYKIEVVLTDEQGNRLFVDRLDYDLPRDQVFIRLRDLNAALSAAEQRDIFGFSSTPSFWRVER